MAPGRHTNGARWPILMAHPRCAISIPDTNGAPGGAPLVKITNGVLLMAHHRCAINGHIRCAISRGFSSSGWVYGTGENCTAQERLAMVEG